ncbi:NAD(P)/FAD-dependent oxidoreductase [Phenylobacterium montanum]|uniref:FAD-dependent oxidoreductase n=1 Tax=Phenylobacterium montanum TaxID=2823693 RepID=A0A975G1P2_9CAUL|nr:FAD-dependent oxidoreductase [Caulobacter sp. S6]QUD89149.1 FAD-dependent oxidoreductase [Caulobacter sp. S6]
MSGLSNARVIVAGAGAFGSAIALRLVQSGARMTLVDPDLGLGRSASAVAAGMLAPALESVLDPETNVPFAMLRAARELWPAFEARIGRDIGLSRAGAAFVDLPGLEPRVEALRSKLKALGAEIAPPPASLDGLNAVFTPEDWRLSPAEALPALLGAFRAAGGTAVRGALAAVEPGAAVLADGGRLVADRVLLATGAAGLGLAPELSRLAPIKGQIVSYPDFTPPAGAPTLRCQGGYAAGGEDGLFVGATMEAGQNDLMADPATVERLHALAGRLYPAVRDLEPIPAVGVRATSPDGRPMVGPSAAPGVLLAVGARRNGWLLAPLVAEITAAYLADTDLGPWAEILAPARFADA